MVCITDHDGFSDIAREHAMTPRHYGPLDKFTGHALITGPCGDTMEFWLDIKDGRINRVSFITDGCGSSLACGSMASTLVEGKLLEDAADLSQQDILKALGGFPADSEHCALLAATTFKAACEDYRKDPSCEEASKEARTSDSTCGTCNDTTCSASQRKPGESEEDFEERQRLQARLSRIRHKVVVLSGKGGVGKSTVAVNLATSLMLAGKKVGLLDVDIHGPSIPTMMGIESVTIKGTEDGFLPIDVGGIKVMSLGFLLRSPDDAVIWRGPLKMGVIKQFLMDAAWGDLDYLIIDSPPGTGDEPLSVCQLIGRLDGAVIVTTPQKVASVDVRKSITFCRQLELPVLGVVENMSGFVCPRCGEQTTILRSGGGETIARDMQIPFLGSIPIDPEIAESGDAGMAYIQRYATSPTAKVMTEILSPIRALDEQALDKKDAEKPLQPDKFVEENIMRIAIPLANGKLSMHFGHCEQFALIDVDGKEKKITERQDIEPPPHEPGLLPRWLAERGANLIIAGGMGQRAQELFAKQNIQVLVGAPSEAPEFLVNNYLAGTLQAGVNTCDH